MSNNLTDQFNLVIEEKRRKLKMQLKRGLNKAADSLIGYYQSSPLTPDDPKDKRAGKYRNSFVKTKTEYENVVYVGSSKTVKGAKSDKIPLSNILEADTATQHMRKIFDQHADELCDIAAEEFNK